MDLASEYNIDLTTRRSCLVTRRDAELADVILVMHRKNYSDLICQFPWVEDKTISLGLFAENGKIEIDDPYGASEDDARICFQQLALSVDGLMKRIFNA